jgi:hypothetical protein
MVYIPNRIIVFLYLITYTIKYNMQYQLKENVLQAKKTHGTINPHLKCTM